MAIHKTPSGSISFNFWLRCYRIVWSITVRGPWSKSTRGSATRDSESSRTLFLGRWFGGGCGGGGRSSEVGVGFVEVHKHRRVAGLLPGIQRRHTTPTWTTHRRRPSSLTVPVDKFWKHAYFAISAQFRYFDRHLPSVLWHCWLGVRKSIRPE